MVRPAARYLIAVTVLYFGAATADFLAATVRQVSPSVSVSAPASTCSSFEGCCRWPGEGKGFAGLHLPAPQLNHIRPGGAGEEPGAAPSGPCQRWDLLGGNNMQRGFACHIDNIRYRYAQRGGEFAEDRNAGIGGLFSISTSIPLLMAGPRDTVQLVSDIFRFTVGLQPRGDGATYLVDIRS